MRADERREKTKDQYVYSIKTSYVNVMDHLSLYSNGPINPVGRACLNTRQKYQVYGWARVPDETVE